MQNKRRKLFFNIEKINLNLIVFFNHEFMSLFEKLIKEDFSDQDNELLKSITNQIAVLFSNRSDLYYSYNFYKKKLCAIHEIFEMNYFDVEFPNRLKDAIESFEPRIKDVFISVLKKNNHIEIGVTAKLVKNNASIPPLKFHL